MIINRCVMIRNEFMCNGAVEECAYGRVEDGFPKQCKFNHGCLPYDGGYISGSLCENEKAKKNAARMLAANAEDYLAMIERGEE